MAKPVFELSLSLDEYVDHDRIPPSARLGFIPA
jgi:hypothetical protein